MSRFTKSILPFAAATVASLAVTSPALAADRDHDGMRDSWEKHYHVANPRLDPDHDGISNLAEFRAHTNPRKADSDGDGISDGAEKRLGTDATSSPHGGGPNDLQAVASLADDLVTFTLGDGRTVTARLTGDTRVECRVEQGKPAVAPVAAAARHGGPDDSPRLDNSGPGNAQDRPVQPATAPLGAADAPADPGAQGQVDNSGPGNAADRCTPEEMDGATVRKAEMRLDDDGVVLTRLELVAYR
jgi:hypothetical protein